MSEPALRGSRGASILAGLIAVAMLGAAVVGIGSSGLYQPAAQVAFSTAAAPVVAPPKVTAPKCTNVIACDQVAAVDAKTALSQPCTPGFKYTVTEEKGRATVTAEPTNPAEPGTCEAAGVPPAEIQNGIGGKPNTCATGNPVQGHIPKGATAVCEYKYCTKVELLATRGRSAAPAGMSDEKCTSGNVPSGTEASLAGVRAQARPDALRQILDELISTDIARMNRSELSGLDSRMASRVDGALEDAKTELQADVSANTDHIKEIDKKIERCAAGRCDAGDDEATLERQKSELAERNRELANQIGKLDGLKKTLAEEAVRGDPAKPPPETPAERTARETRERAEAGAAALRQQETFGGGRGMGGLEKMLQGLGGGRGGSGGAPGAGNQTPQAPGTCAAGQLLCSGNTLYSRNNQCVDTVVQTCQHGCYGNACVQQGQNCPAAPVQPDPSGCQVGTWKPTYTGACVNGWQCTSGSGTGQFAAQISCQPQIADVGMSLAISYSCSSGTSSGSGFQTNGAQSGSATVTIANPPANTNTATYGLTCTNQGQTTRADCTVQVGKPSIVLVANPKAVATSTASQLGWVTSGMQSCVISSPDLPAFTSQNANNTSVNGTATTPPLTSAARFLLHCITVGGGTRQASTTVSISGVPDTFNDPGGTGGSITVSSTADATTIAHGATTTITWSTQGAPSGSLMSLWVFDERLNQTTVLITDGKPTSGSFEWRIPGLTDPCDTNSSIACASDLVASRKYLIEAALYTPTNAYLGNGAPPADPIDPTYIDFGFGDPFTMGD